MDRSTGAAQVVAVAIPGGPAVAAPMRSHVVLDDGTRVLVRPITPADLEPLREMHRRLSPVSVSRRFFAALPELSHEQAERFTRVDGVERAALVAVNEAGELIAVVRYDRMAGTADAEVAVVVQDSYQHHRLGTTLLRLLTDHARACGIERFLADVLLENGRMFAAFRDAGLVGTTKYEYGIGRVVLPLPPPAVPADPTACAAGTLPLPVPMAGA